MAFVAYYSRTRLLGLAGIAVLFVAMGAVMVTRPADAFVHSTKIRMIGWLFGGDNGLAGHALGWMVTVFGITSLLVFIRQMMHRDPALRIDSNGIYWHRWSSQSIPWDNIVRFEQTSISRQKFLALWLRDASRNRAAGIFGKIAGVNKALGFGDISLSVQGTDKSFDELLEATGVHSTRYRQSLTALSSPQMCMADAESPRRTFGRKRG